MATGPPRRDHRRPAGRNRVPATVPGRLGSGAARPARAGGDPMTSLTEVAYVTSKESNVWRECAGCGASAPLPPGEDRCGGCTAVPDKPARRPRSDAGQVRLTERDIAVFRWLSDMKAIYEDDLAALLVRMPGTPWTAAGRRPSA